MLLASRACPQQRAYHFAEVDFGFQDLPLGLLEGELVYAFRICCVYLVSVYM